MRKEAGSAGAKEMPSGKRQLVSEVYAELRRIAAAQMARLPSASSTLQPTALFMRRGCG